MSWLAVGCYHPPSQNDDYYLCNLSKVMDSLNSVYEKFILTGDFNSEDHEIEISSFLNNHEARNVVKEKTCFKSVLSPSCVDILLQTALKALKEHSFPCGFSDHHNCYGFEKHLWKVKF